MRRLLACVLLIALLTPLTAAQADFSYARVNAVLNQRLSCRSGPGTQYEEPVNYFSAGTSLTLLAKAYDQRNGVWWVMVEFSYKSMRYRAYTGAKRFDNLNLDRLPTEVQMGSGSTPGGYPVEAWWGPGANSYKRMSRNVPGGVSVTIWGYAYNGAEDTDFVLIEFYDRSMGCTRRAWVKEWAIEETYMDYGRGR